MIFQCVCVFFYSMKNIKILFIRSNSNKQTITSFSIAFCLSISYIQYFYHYDLIHQLLLQVCTLENKDQFCGQRHFIYFAYFFLQNHLFFDSVTVFCFLLITTNSINPRVLLICMIYLFYNPLLFCY